MSLLTQNKYFLSYFMAINSYRKVYGKVLVDNYFIIGLLKS